MKSGNGNEMRDNSRHLDINGSAAHSYVSNQYIPEQTVLGEMAQPCYGGASAGPGACYAYEAVGNEYNESTKYPSGYTVVCSEATGSGSGIGMEPNRRLAPSGSDNLGMSSTQANPPRSETRPKRKTVLRAAGGETWEDPTLLDWDPNDFRMFCGDLGNDVTDELLSATFSKYPSFLKAKVVRDKKTNKTRGFGFISFKDRNDFSKAMKEMNGKYIGSRPIKLRKSNWKLRTIDLKSLKKLHSSGQLLRIPKK